MTEKPSVSALLARALGDTANFQLAEDMMPADIWSDRSRVLDAFDSWYKQRKHPILRKP